MSLMHPDRWPQQDVAKYLALTRSSLDFASATGESDNAMVLGSTGAFAQYAGVRALQAGGNAIDAAIVTSLTQITLAAGSWVSFAGIATLIVHDPRTGETHSVNGPFRPFKNETDAATIPAPPTPSGRTALVPGFMAAIYAAHKRFGRLPWSQLWVPSIWLCENGAPVNDILLGAIPARCQVLQRMQETREIFFPKGANPWTRGGWFKQLDLALTLRKIAEQGACYLYQGEWAEAFVRQVNEQGGRASLDDLRTYEPVISTPLVANVYGHQLRTVAAPDTGGATLAEGLRLLEALDVGDPLTSGEHLYWMTQALHQSSANRFFSNSERTSDAHITRVARAMKAAGGAVRGTTLLPGTHSDYVVAADGSGMMVSLCHSVNTSMWGTTGINVGGISISDAASFQQEEMARMQPGDYLPNAMNPTIVFKDGQPVLAFSSVGAGLMSVSLQSVHAVLGLGLGVQEVVRRPRLHGSNLLAGDSVTSGGGRDREKKPLELTEAIVTLRARTLAEGVDPRDLEGLMVKSLSLCIENTFDAAVIADAQSRGVRLDPMDVADRKLSRGFWGAIERDPKSGHLKGGRTPGAAGQIVTA